MKLIDLIRARLKRVGSEGMLAGALGLLLALGLLASLVAPALAVEQVPHQFWGNVTIGGVQAPADTTVVMAEVREVQRSTTVDAEGRYGWDPLFFVPADDPGTGEIEGGQNGDTVDFYVNGVPAASYTPFKIGERTSWDLNILPGVTYDLTVTSNGCCPITVEGFGTVDANDTDVFQVPVDTDVTVTADDSSPSCQFDSWSDGGDKSHSVHMDDDKSVIAYCSTIGPTYDLTVTSNGCCPITVEGFGTVDANSTDTFQIPVDTDVTVTADDSDAYCQFDSWSDGGDKSHSIYMDTDKSVTAYCSTIGVIPGDADGDGEVTVLDMTMVARIILELEDETPGADANEDGEVNVLDITEIARIILG